MLSWFQGENQQESIDPSHMENGNHDEKDATANDHDSSLLQMMAFNQNKACVAVATLKGFHVFDGNGFQEQLVRLFPLHSHKDSERMRYAGVKIVEALYRSNIFALVGANHNPPLASINDVVIWDNQAAQVIGQISMDKPVRAVILHTKYVVVVQEDKVKVFEHDLRQKKSFETSHNPTGIVALSLEKDNAVLALPFVTKGMVRCEMLDADTRQYIQAHEGEIAGLALTADGTRLATCSERGTLIRIFDTHNGNQLKEVRRGSTQAKVWDIAFSNDNRYMCCVASSGSLHVFDIGSTVPKDRLIPSNNEKNAPNRTSSLSVLGMVGVGWAQSEWSFAEYKEEAFAQEGCKCAFGSSNKQVLVTTKSGFFFDVTFDLEIGEVRKVDRYDIMRKLEAASG